MGFRRWIGWLAVAAILLHAATVARHHVVQFRAASAEVASAAFELGLICHVDGDADGNGQSLPGKDRNSPSKPCPVCLGLASAHALPASDAPALRVPQAVTQMVSAPLQAVRTTASRFLLPLTRGPPSLA